MKSYYRNINTGEIAYILTMQGPVYVLVNITTGKSNNWNKTLFVQNWKLLNESGREI